MQIYGLDVTIPEQCITLLAENAAEARERARFEAVKAGTSTFYAVEPQDESGELYICGETCKGFRPSKLDPLAQVPCPWCEPHCPQKVDVVRTCYKPRLIDQQVAEEIDLTEKMDNLEQIADTMTSMGGWKDATEEGPEEEEARVRWLQDTHK
jgi:regulator of RNase E activity RraB